MNLRGSENETLTKEPNRKSSTFGNKNRYITTFIFLFAGVFSEKKIKLGLQWRIGGVEYFSSTRDLRDSN